MDLTESYVLKKEVDWSLLTEGITVPNKNRVVFGRIMERFLSRGESKDITLLLNGKSYKAKINNVNFGEKYNRKEDTLQIRYSRNGELANEMKRLFYKSYNYINNIRNNRQPGDRSAIRLPDECKEYLTIYTTEYDDTYLLETIASDDLTLLKSVIASKNEIEIENFFSQNILDVNATIEERLRLDKIRKIDTKIGDNLKLLYNFRCQICGKKIGEEYETNVAQAHHIDYFIQSLNNDSNNQLVVCPNHHYIIHNINPTFNRETVTYIYPNGLQEKLQVNKHL